MATYCHLLIDLNFLCIFVCVSFGFVLLIFDVFVVLYNYCMHVIKCLWCMYMYVITVYVYVCNHVVIIIM